MSKLAVKTIEKAQAGRYFDGDGLWLIVSPTGAKKWSLRFSLRGKSREMGLGSFPETTLAEAREKAFEARKLARNGIDPIEDRKRKSVPTFGVMTDEVIAGLDPKFHAKHLRQWAMTMTVYAAPLRPRPVDSITTADVLAVLKPLWTKAPETASRVRGRIEKVLNAAQALGHIDEGRANPARWRGHLQNLLTKPNKRDRGHYAAMRYDEVSAFIARLREHESIGALALEFLILTAARSAEVLGARWEEINFDAALWTIPKARMKAGTEHRVPLSDPALAVLHKLREIRTSEFVFPGQKKGRSLSATVFNKLLSRMKVAPATSHGFRSAFRDWCGNETNAPREVAEEALAHTIGNKTERSYRRQDALKKRRELMDAWAAYCDRQVSADVIPLRPAVKGNEKRHPSL